MSQSDFRTTILDEQEYGAWSKFVACSPTGSIYSMPEYLDILCSVVGGRFSILAVVKEEELVGGIALYETRTRVGPVISNRLLLYYNGIVVPAYSTRYESKRASQHIGILTCLRDTLDTSRYAHVLLQNRHWLNDIRPFLTTGWRVHPGYSYVVDLTDLDKAWARIDRNQRRLIERSRDRDTSLVENGEFSDFYRMHLNTHLRKGAPVYLPEAVFKKYVTRLRETNLGTLFHLTLSDGTSVASQLVLTGPHKTSHTVCACADENHLSLGSTPGLRWLVFQKLHTLGYAGNDLTDASLNEVTRFKGQLGGQLVLNFTLTRSDSFAFRLYSKYLRARLHFGGVVRKLIPQTTSSLEAPGTD